MAASEFTVNVAPQFLPSVTDSEKIKFEKRIKITSSADWVRAPPIFFSTVNFFFPSFLNHLSGESTL